MQFTVVFNNGGSILVQAPDKYEAIEQAKKRNPSNTTGVKLVKDCYGKPC